MHHRKSYMCYNFQQNRVRRSVKTVHTNLFANFLIRINLQLAIRIYKNHALRTCTAPSRTFRPILRSIDILDFEIPRKEIISTDVRRTDGRHDGQTMRTATICSFLLKKNNLLKTKDLSYDRNHYWDIKHKILTI